jgi:hypothetical protein
VSVAFTFTATPDLGPKAMRFLLWRRAGIFGPLAVVLLPILLAVLARDPAMRPFAYAFAGAAIMLFVIFLIGVAHLRRLRKRFYATAKDHTIDVSLDDDGVTVKTALATTQMPWSAFERLWVGKQVVLLFHHGWQRLAFPRDAVPQAAIDLVVAKLAGK